METFFNVRNISKSFGPTKALVDVNLELKKGEIRALLGENGSGKSTLASVIVGLQKADSGSMSLNGKPYMTRSIVDAGKNHISMIVQEMCTIDMMTVAENIYIGNESRFTSCGFLDVNKMNMEAQKLLDSLKASHIRAGDMIDYYSLEERKVIEMARALVSEPELLIIDETTTALTQYGREFIYSLMHKMRDENKTVLFISHDLDEVQKHCDSATIMRDGCVISTITGEDINPENIRTLISTFLNLGRSNIK